jgi:Fn3-like domain
MTRILVVLLLAIVGGTATAQTVTLSPAVVPLGGRPGQSTTQRLTVANGTSRELSFELVAKDVVIRNGARTFVTAGELPNSIAASAVFSTRKVTVPPGEERAVRVTVTLPPQLPCRAIVVLFQGTTRLSDNATASIGSLLTFDLSGKVLVAPGDVMADPPTASSNTAIRLPIRNTGNEPAVVRGAAAIIAASGALVGKVALDSRRLLPGESTVLRADYAGELSRGGYRVIATIESAQQSWTRTTELTIP